MHTKPSPSSRRPSTVSLQAPSHSFPLPFKMFFGSAEIEIQTPEFCISIAFRNYRITNNCPPNWRRQPLDRRFARHNLWNYMVADWRPESHKRERKKTGNPRPHSAIPWAITYFQLRAVRQPGPLCSAVQKRWPAMCRSRAEKMLWRMEPIREGISWRQATPS